MEILKAEEKHVSGILDLWEEFTKYHEPMDPRFPMVDKARESYELYLRNLMTDKDTKIMVADENNRPVGYVVAQIRKSMPGWQREKYGSISEMAVTKTHRRNGIGKTLLKEILAWFKSEGIDYIEISVASENKIGLSFWKKHGFKNYLHHMYLKL
jgi:ribosomal protein S18 acetylase RimI-like enzyme